MKKHLLTFAMTLVLCASIQAQTGVDVTSKYLTNGGFDEDISMTAAGKAAKGTEDGSAWTANANGGYDGFIAQIKGWKVLNRGTAPKWLYMGSLPYAYDATSQMKAPDRPTEANTEDNAGVLMLKAGWGGTVGYSQKVALPAGHYKLTYFIVNKASTTAKAKNRCVIQCGADSITDTEAFKNTEWTKREYTLTSTDSLSISFGFSSVNAGSGSNPALFVDDIHLYKLDGVTQQEVLADAINTLLKKCNSLLNSLSYDGLSAELQNAVDEAKGKVTSDDVQVLQTAYDSLNNTYLSVSEALNEMATIKSLLQRIEKLLNYTHYPGADKLDAARTNAEEDQYSKGSAGIVGIIKTLNDAIVAYYQSQVATVDTPADYTYLVQHPWFVNPNAEPTKNEDGTYTFPGASNFSNGKACSDANSTGWYIGASGGDQRCNVAQLRPCWNAWNLNFTSISVNQNLTGIPDGYYKLSADLDIAAGCATTQHVFASSTTGKVTSNPDWSAVNDYQGVWYNVTTTDKVLVTGGKLTIGAESTGDKVKTPADFGGTNTDKRRGWFCVTNFKLSYLGKASMEDITSAYKKKLTDGNSLADTMHLAADKAALKSVMNAYSNATDETSINFALDTLQTAIGKALKSEAKYAEVMAAGKTIPTVSDSLLSDTAYNAAHDIVAYAYGQVKDYMASDSAQYTQLDDLISRLRSYSSTYAPEFNVASEELGKITSQTVADYLDKILKAQKQVLTTGDMQSDSVVAAMVSQLSSAVLLAEKQNAYDANPNATDYTGFIQNPKAEAETGWVLNKGYGDKNIGSGQYYDTSDPTHCYFNSYNVTAGKLNFMGYQVVVGIPNGTYTVAADVRTSGNGAFIFAAGDTVAVDTTWMEIPLQKYTYMDQATGKDTTVIAADKYGQIWQDAITEYQQNPSKSELAHITNANGDKGYGWEHISIANVEVRNHIVVIGMSTNIKYTHKAFDGKWFSVTNWTLNQTAAGDNKGWTGPLTTNIQSVINGDREGNDGGIYNVNGMKVSDMSRPGLYIIKKNGRIYKIMKR